MNACIIIIVVIIIMDEHDGEDDFGTIQRIGRQFIELFLSEHIATLIDHLLSVVYDILCCHHKDHQIDVFYTSFVNSCDSS